MIGFPLLPLDRVLVQMRAWYLRYVVDPAEAETDRWVASRASDIRREWREQFGADWGGWRYSQEEAERLARSELAQARGRGNT